MKLLAPCITLALLAGCAVPASQPPDGDSKQSRDADAARRGRAGGIGADASGGGPTTSQPTSGGTPGTPSESFGNPTRKP